MELKVKNPEIIDYLITLSNNIGSCEDADVFNNDEISTIIDTIKNTITLREYDELKIHKLLELYNSSFLENSPFSSHLYKWAISYLLLNPSKLVSTTVNNKSISQFMKINFDKFSDLETYYKEIFGFNYSLCRDQFSTYTRSIKYIHNDILFYYGDTEFSLIVFPTIISFIYTLIKTIEIELDKNK